jgi:predicted RND superfamily exporter protein
MMTLLPVLLLKGRQNVLDHEEGNIAERRARIENLWLQRPVLVTCITVTLCAVAALQIHKVYFDYNLLHMQSAGLPAVEFEKKLLDSADKSVLFGAVIATNLEQAVRLEEQLKKLPAVADVDSILRLHLTDDQTRKLQMVRDIKAGLNSLSFAVPDTNAVDIPGLSATLYSLYGYLGAAYDEIHADEPALSKNFVSLRSAVGDLRKEMLRGDEAELKAHLSKLAAFQQSLFSDIKDTFHALQTQDDSGPLTVQDLPQALRDRFIGVTGKYLLMVYPKNDVWQRENQKEFIEQVQTVYPNVTGTPVQLYHYTDLLRKSYEEAARYSLAAIVLLVLFHFRSALCVALALVPVGVGFIWLGGLMGSLAEPLNPANIMMLPLVIGIGVTNGIHILNRYAEEQTPNILARSTGKAVLVSGLTAIAGFGSLMLAKHQGIQSLGYVMSAGLATCMIAGLTFLPALLNLLTRPGEKKRPSADNARSTLSREEPRSKTSSLRID